MSMATKLRINAFKMGFCVGIFSKKSQQEITDAASDNQTTNQSLNKSQWKR